MLGAFGNVLLFLCLLILAVLIGLYTLGYAGAVCF